MKHKRHDADSPVLITAAPLSRDEELARRKRRYLITMIIRALCVIAAAISINVPWLAIAFCIAAVFLPWMAVLVANDRPPKKAEKVNRYGGGPAPERALDSAEADRKVIEG